MVIHSRQARTLVAFLAFAALIAFGVAACESPSARSPVSPSFTAVGDTDLNVKPGTPCGDNGNFLCNGRTVGDHCSNRDFQGVCRPMRQSTDCSCR